MNQAGLLRRLMLVPALLALALWFQESHWDWLVVDSFYDAVESRFPLRGLWWTDRLLHDGGALLVVLTAVAALAGLLYTVRSPRLQPYRGDLAYVLLCIALTTGLVALLKRYSGIHCPVDLARYGGRFHYEALVDRLLRPLAGQGRPGSCFPGGHSSGALSMLALYFLALRRSSPHADRVLIAVAGSGLVFGLTQWMRGSHFPSHDISSAAVAWSVCAVLDALRRPPIERQAQHDARTGVVVFDLAAAVVQQRHRTDQG